MFDAILVSLSHEHSMIDSIHSLTHFSLAARLNCSQFTSIFGLSKQINFWILFLIVHSFSTVLKMSIALNFPSFLPATRRLTGFCRSVVWWQACPNLRGYGHINTVSLSLEKILSIPNEELTLERAFGIADSHETACRNVREMQMSAN